jgi:hypothetical protein
MAAPAKTVKDVSSHEFVKEYASYLRSTGKVRSAATALSGTHGGVLRGGVGDRGRALPARAGAAAGRAVTPPAGSLPAALGQPGGVRARAAHADLRPLQP